MNPQNLQQITEIETIIIDLESLGKFAQECEPVLETLIEREFQVVLLATDIEKWEQWKDRCVLSTSREEILNNFQENAQNVMCVTDSNSLQNQCIQMQIIVICLESKAYHEAMIRLLNFQDLVMLLDPSRLASMQIAQELAIQKDAQPEKAMMVLVEGVENCGHIVFVVQLIEQLEQCQQMVSGLDLTELKTLEHAPNYWNDPAQRDWVMHKIINPFSKNERLLIKDAPEWAVEKDITEFPLFLTPEMIFVVWGSCLLTDGIEAIDSKKIFLNLSDKAATARLFGINQEENFDPAFIEKYQATEGHLYHQYLQQSCFQSLSDWQVQFDSLEAFRIHS